MTKLRASAVVLAAAVSTAALSGCAGALIGAGAGAGSAAAQERGLEGALSDTKIRAEINDLWLRRDFDMYRKVDLNILEGRVMLTGVVKTDQARAEAVRLTWQAAGVKEVYNEIEVVPDGEGFAGFSRDTWIQEKLNTKLLLDKEIQSINYVIDVVHGVVYVMGIAQSQEELDRVLAYARDISDVQRVVNHVLVKTDPRRVSG